MREIFYISGPMTGHRQFNIPFFDRVALKMRQLGYEVVNPVDSDPPEVKKAAVASETGNLGDISGLGSWGELMAKDIRIIADEVTGILLLPGWTSSRGAKLEAFVGLLTDKDFMGWDDLIKSPYPLTPADIRGSLRAFI